MIISKNAESLAWIIVWIFILSFVLLWIWNLIWNSRETISQFNTQMEIDILTKNSLTILDKLDLSSINKWDTFYLYKNIWTQNYEVSTSSWNIYINKYWEKVNSPSNYNWLVYERSFELKKIDIKWDEKISIEPLIEKFNK